MKRDVYDNRVSEAIKQIRRRCYPKPSKWHHIGYRQGKRVFMTESCLRRCNLDDICADPLLQPVQQRKARGPGSNRRASVSDSLWCELLGWLGKSLLEMMSGQRS